MPFSRLNYLARAQLLAETKLQNCETPERAGKKNRSSCIGTILARADNSDNTQLPLRCFAPARSLAHPTAGHHQINLDRALAGGGKQGDDSISFRSSPMKARLLLPRTAWPRNWSSSLTGDDERKKSNHTQTRSDGR